MTAFDPKRARWWCKVGGVVAAIDGVFVVLLTTYALLNNSHGSVLSHFNDPWVYIDAVLLFAVGYFIWRCSRVACLLALLIFTVGLLSVLGVSLVTDLGGIKLALLVAYHLVLLVLYARVCAAAFRMAQERENDTPVSRRQRLMIALGSVIGVLLVVLLSVGLVSLYTNWLPPVEILKGDAVPKKLRDALVEREVLYDDEEITYFYTYGSLSSLEGGYILTPDGLTEYYESEDEPGKIETGWLEAETISRIEKHIDEEYFNMRYYRVYGDGADEYIDLYFNPIRDPLENEFVRSVCRISSKCNMESVEKELMVKPKQP